MGQGLSKNPLGSAGLHLVGSLEKWSKGTPPNNLATKPRFSAGLSVFNPAFPEGRFEHFIRRHQEELIQRVSLLAGALGLLSMDVLHPEQYQSIMAEGSDQDRMRKLYELVPTWGTMGKDQLYWALKQTNQDLITELLGNIQPLCMRRQACHRGQYCGGRGKDF